MKFILISIAALVCISSVLCKTDCEQHRERELRPGNKFATRLIPNCDKNGDYEPVQCHGDATEKKRACQCWAKNGDILTSPSFKLRHCSCVLAKKEAEKTRGARMPTCDADGRFTRMQCVGAKCDCVNQDTGKKENC